MYTQYTKPPIEEPKNSKKSKKKNNNASKTLYLDRDQDPQEIASRFFTNQSSDSKEGSNVSPFSEDDYINDLSEYQEELLNSAFFEENPEFQEELSNTCNELVEFFKEKSITGTEGEFDHMLQICQDNAKWFLPIQAAYENESKMEILDEFLLNDKDFIVAIQEKIFEINKINRKQPKNEYEYNSSKYISKFPSLSETNPNQDKELDFLKPSQSKNSSLPSKNQKESLLKFGDLELNDMRNQWIQPYNNDLFQTLKAYSRDEVRGLSLLFPNIGINYIKIAYLSFGEDPDITKEFLNEYFKDSYKPGAIIENTKQIQKEQMSFVQNKKKEVAYFYEDDSNIEEIDPELRNESFANLRLKVSKHLRLKMILNKSERTCLSVKNYSEAKKFQNLANEQEAILKKYIKASKQIFLEKLRKKNNYREVDLHGLFLEEAFEIVMDQIKYIKNKMAMGLVADCAVKDVKGMKHLKYEIITGKGKNSKNKVPILLPNLKKFFEKRKYEFKVVEHEGKIELYLPF